MHPYSAPLRAGEREREREREREAQPSIWESLSLYTQYKYKYKYNLHLHTTPSAAASLLLFPVNPSAHPFSLTQHLLQSQLMMASFYSNNVTSDHIQQYLDENKSLILKIVESQNSGKLSECAESQARLQRNLMYLAAIADSQSPPPTMHSQFPPTGVIQPGAYYMQHQAEPMTPQALMAARSSMLYNQQPYAALQQSQTLHGQLGMSHGAGGGLNMLHSDPGGAGGSSALGGFSDFGRGGKDMGSSGSGEGRSGSGDGGEALYLKSHADDGN